MSRNTSGPWTIAHGGIVFGGDKVQVALVTISNRESEERDANARLIAAAPELLSFAKHALEFFDWSRFPNLREGLEELITKAEGGVS